MTTFIGCLVSTNVIMSTFAGIFCACNIFLKCVIISLLFEVLEKYLLGH
jgi:hypothetical protein